MKRLWTVFFLLVACDVSLVTAPGDDTNATDGGTIDQATTCPSVDPGDGGACSLPEGTTCSFESCGSRIAQCRMGFWVFGSNPPPKPQCPELAPAQGGSCSQCWPEGVVCPYVPTSCEPNDGSVPNNTVASCLDASWTLSFLPCRDAGADVQGDAKTDAD